MAFLGALALGTTAMVKPSLAASFRRSWPRGAGRTSPARPTSPKARNPLGRARPRRLEVMDSMTARSAAGSLMRTPPTALTNTSWSAQATPAWRLSTADRKSTRLNSSHLVISYAVFCLKKKITHLAAFVHCVRQRLLSKHILHPRHRRHTD